MIELVIWRVENKILSVFQNNRETLIGIDKKMDVNNYTKIIKIVIIINYFVNI